MALRMWASSTANSLKHYSAYRPQLLPFFFFLQMLIFRSSTKAQSPPLVSVAMPKVVLTLLLK
ncbi:hypothetical protein JHK82_027826 [Glycine max]|nr:hypothetical protein JHK82_027826 [Glycine max]